MRKITLVWVLCLMACMGATTTQAQNLLQCPGFEDDNFADVWSNYFGDLVSVVSDDHYSGTKSCKLITDVAQISEVFQTVEITAGKAYTLSIYNKLLNNGGNGTAMLGYTFLDADGSGLSDFVSVPVTSTQGTWVKSSLSTDIAPAGAVYISFTIQNTGGAGTSVLFDDASFTIKTIDGINEVRTQLPVHIQNGNIIVTTQSGSMVDVYNAIGIKLQSQTANSTETTLSNLPQGQVLIVRSGNAVAKVIL